MMLRMRQTDEHGREQREHVSLNKGHQQLHTIHEEEHDGTEEIESETHAYAHRPAQEYHAREAQDDGVSGHHVGKETDHQCEGLGEDAHHLDDGNERCGIRLEEQGHLGPEDFLPVFLVAEDVDQEHRAEGEEERDVDVARHVGSTWEYG